jgi:outer membrane protein TolC
LQEKTVTPEHKKRRFADVIRFPVGVRLGAMGLLVLFMALVSPGTVSAESLSLADAVRLARKNSPAILESEAKKEAARQAKREAWLNHLPAIQVREIAMRTDSPADVFGLQLMQERFSFPAFMATDPNNPEPFDNFTTEIQATMPLFTGWQLESGIKQADQMAKAAAAVRDHTEFAVELGVVSAYLNAVLAERFVSLAEKALGTTVEHVEQAQAFFDAGMMVESDLLQARVQQARMEEDRISALNNARLAQAGLSRAMGMDQSMIFTLEEEPWAPAPVAKTYEEALELASRSRKDLEAVEAQVEAARAGVTRAKGEYWPGLAVSAKYSLSDNKLFGDHGDSYAVMAMLQWNVWNWGQTHTRVARSKSERAAALESQRAYVQQVEFEVRQAWQGVEEARARHEVAAEAVAAAEKALTILGDRFTKGVARVTDLLDTETLAHEARVREVQARFDLQRSIRTLNFATGASPVPEVSR